VDRAQPERHELRTLVKRLTGVATGSRNRPGGAESATVIGRSKAAPSRQVDDAVDGDLQARIADGRAVRLSRTVESGKPTVLTVGATPPLWLSA
jgi:hypothetical protein